MGYDSFFYNTSPEHIDAISGEMMKEVSDVIERLPKRQKQAQINQDFWWLMTARGWSYDACPAGTSPTPPHCLGVRAGAKSEIQKANRRQLCRTSTTLDARWCADFAKRTESGLVHLEVQFGTVEAMFKDFCGFKIAFYERRIALGIEVVLSKPTEYFAHRKSAISGMAYFDIAKRTLPALGLSCPIWLIGLH